MTPESTSSVFPLRTNTAGAQSRLLLLLFMYHHKICLQSPKALHTSRCAEGWGNCDCVMFTCKIWKVRWKKLELIKTPTKLIVKAGIALKS